MKIESADSVLHQLTCHSHAPLSWTQAKNPLHDPRPMQDEDRSTPKQLLSEQQSQLVSSYGHSCLLFSSERNNEIIYQMYKDTNSE